MSSNTTRLGIREIYFNILLVAVMKLNINPLSNQEHMMPAKIIFGNALLSFAQLYAGDNKTTHHHQLLH